MAIRVRIKRNPRRHLFTLGASPELIPDGPLRGHLDYIIFTAKTTKGMHVWHARKTGNLIADFSALVPHQQAVEIVRDLYLGHKITLPGRYPLDLLKDRFDFTGMD